MHNLYAMQRCGRTAVQVVIATLHDAAIIHGAAGTHEAAAALLALADESNLPKLKAVCLDHILHHYPAVAATEAYKGLTASQRDLIAAEACSSYAQLREVLKVVACRKTIPGA